jgi:hypothetical protein
MVLQHLGISLNPGSVTKFDKVKRKPKISYFLFWSSISPYFALTPYSKLSIKQNDIIKKFNKFSDTLYGMFMYFKPRTTEKGNCHMSRDIVWLSDGG